MTSRYSISITLYLVHVADALVHSRSHGINSRVFYYLLRIDEMDVWKVFRPLHTSIARSPYVMSL